MSAKVTRSGNLVTKLATLILVHRLSVAEGVVCIRFLARKGNSRDGARTNTAVCHCLLPAPLSGIFRAVGGGVCG